MDDALPLGIQPTERQAHSCCRPPDSSSPSRGRSCTATLDRATETTSHSSHPGIRILSTWHTAREYSEQFIFWTCQTQSPRCLSCTWLYFPQLALLVKRSRAR